jgi:hypothetical protein
MGRTLWGISRLYINSNLNQDWEVLGGVSQDYVLIQIIFTLNQSMGA